MTDRARYPFHSRTLTVALGPNRDARFAAAAGYFADHNPRYRLMDATDRNEEAVINDIRDFVRAGLDRIAVRNPGPRVLARLFTLADTGHMCVATMDVTDLTAARAQIVEASAYEIPAEIIVQLI